MSIQHTLVGLIFAFVLVTVHKKLLKSMDRSGKLANIFIGLVFLLVFLGCSPTQNASDHQDIRISGSTRSHGFMTYSLVYRWVGLGTSPQDPGSADLKQATSQV